MKLSGMGRALKVLVVLCAFAAGAFIPQLFFFLPARGQNASAAQADKRVALVIGNGSYPQSPVRTAVADAKAIAELLKAGGFDVIYSEDAQHADLTAAIKQFSQKLARGSSAIVYVSGHAIQFENRNFIIPVDGTIASDADVHSNTV